MRIYKTEINIQRTFAGILINLIEIGDQRLNLHINSSTDSIPLIKYAISIQWDSEEDSWKSWEAMFEKELVN